MPPCMHATCDAWPCWLQGCTCRAGAGVAMVWKHGVVSVHQACGLDSCLAPSVGSRNVQAVRGMWQESVSAVCVCVRHTTTTSACAKGWPAPLWEVWGWQWLAECAYSTALGNLVCLWHVDCTGGCHRWVD